MLKEFKEFALRGNMLDLAIGLVIGIAFGKIVTSLVVDIIMPPIGLLINSANFSDLRVVIRPKANGMDEIAIRYGNFIHTIFEFLIIALSVFLLVKVINKNRLQKQEPRDEELSEISLLTQIRDLLKK